MKAIFTYPNNAATHYIDPNYVGDNTTGYKKRINDLLSGTTFPWNGALPSVDADTFMETTSKYYRYYEFGAPDDSSEISSVAFNRRPALIGYAGLETPVAALDYFTLTDTDWDKTYPTRRYYVANHGLNNGDYIILPYHHEGTYHRTGYARVWNANEFSLTISSTLDDPWLYEDDLLGEHIGAFVTRESNGARVWYHYPHGVVDGDAIKLSNNFTEAHDTGTANSETTQFYAAPGFSQYSHRVYTDSGLTVDATLTENYHDSKTWTFTNSTGGDLEFNLQDLDVSGLPGIGGLQAENFMTCRVVATNLSSGGSFGDKVDSTKGINWLSIDYDYEFWFQYKAGALVDIYADRNATIFADFTLSAGASVDITAYFVNPARIGQGGYYKNLEQVDLTGGEVWYRNNINYTGLADPITPMWTIQSIDLQVPGNQIFEYLDSGGNSVFGAQPSWYAGPGGGQTNFDTAPVINFTNVGGGNNRIATATLDLNSSRAIDPSYDEVIIAIQPKPSEYVPPAPTPAEIASWEDGWDLKSEWDNRTGWELNKDWPLIPYKSIKVKMNQPSVKTMSQSGQKYIRSGGYARWTMEVEYPPLTEEQFNEILTVSHLARGQATVFEFFIKDYYPVDDMLQWGNWWEWRHWQPKTYTSPAGPGVSTVNPVVIRWLDDRTVLVDGYASNESTPVPEGQLISLGNSRNGSNALTVNSNDANVYGELAIRVAYNDFEYKPIQSQYVWTTPHSVAVSLASDELNYTLGADGYYYLTVSFDLDYWK